MNKASTDNRQVPAATAAAPASADQARLSVRLKSQDLFLHAREVEIEHAGRIYRLRLTQQNKLILTA